MTTRTVRTPTDHAAALRFLEQYAPPYTLSVTRGAKRSTEQNALQWKWCQEIADQRGDVTPHEVQAECKLHFGVPILRRDDHAFREQYDGTVKGLPYAAKLAIMQPPIEFPVTRLMNVKQLTEYLDLISRHYREQGFILTEPELA